MTKLFKGKTINEGIWVKGHYSTSIEKGDNGLDGHNYRETIVSLHHIVSNDGVCHVVYPDTISEYSEAHNYDMINVQND